LHSIARQKCIVNKQNSFTVTLSSLTDVLHLHTLYYRLVKLM